MSDSLSSANQPTRKPRAPETLPPATVRLEKVKASVSPEPPWREIPRSQLAHPHLGKIRGDGAPG
jgi:hypothetical protein